ncbi:MAG: DUF3179 domain-containing protein [Acidobacteria bacterium]|nr:DUF3179 domain-containing protein [Acidobacteriota bacterium]
MYSRDYDGLELNFEASGGLVNSSLVMQDKETDTYWSIMKGSATAGQLSGTSLVELPVSEKTSWAEWRAKHPTTRVLSVDGAEYRDDGYESYWASDEGFRGQMADDERLDTKAPIFAFTHGNSRFAVAHAAIEGGHVVELPDGARLFLHRPAGSAMFRSTVAFVSRAGFIEDGGAWVELESGARFAANEGKFAGDVEQLQGFDTFWYNWSLNNPDTEVLR